MPLKTPSHVSILTGLLAPRHGIRNNESFGLGDAHENISDVLPGLRTGAFITAIPLESGLGSRAPFAERQKVE